MSPRLRHRRRRTRRYDLDPTPLVLGRGLLVCVVLAVLGYVSISLYSGVPGRAYDHVTAVVPETGSLIPHDVVRIGGVRVGQVESISSDPQGRGQLELQLEDGTKLPEDTKIRLRANGLLGARFVELVPGKSKRLLAAGEPLRGDGDSLTFVATDALDTFDRETRGAARPFLGELGTGLLGQGTGVNDALRRGSDAIVRFNVLMDRLLEQPEANAALLPALDRGLAPLADDRRELLSLARTAADAVQPFVAEREGLRGALDEAPAAMDAAKVGLTSTRRLLHATRGLAQQANVVLPEAPPGLRATAALLRESPAPLAKARALLDAAAPAVPGALKITSALSPVLPRLKEVFGDLTPVSRQVGRYECNIENFAAAFRSMTGFGTSAGGDGPAGPAVAFRLQLAPPGPLALVGAKETTGLEQREGLPAPCTYLSKPYPIVEKPALGGSSR